MRAELKYVASGIGIGLLTTGIFMVVLFAIASPGSSAQLAVTSLRSTLVPATTNMTTVPPTASATPLPTHTLTATSTPSPTATLTSTQRMIAGGEVVVAGPLISAERIGQLYEAALKYVAPSTGDSRRIGEAINGQGYGSPSNICGPLSIAILRDAAIVGQDSFPHDFWLLNPKLPADRAVLARTFPEERFEHHINKNPLNRIDWAAAPLLPGDFLYIEEGTGGNFDHMLVVSRVDAGGRAYSVTNFNTAEGFVISETMLYDPSNPDVGIFRTWTARPNSLLGSTGFGGFELWRIAVER